MAAAGRVFAQPCAVRAGGPVVARHLVTLSATFLTAYVLGLLPLLVQTIRRAEAGGPAFAGIATGLLGMVMLTALGYGIGAITGSAWLTPLTLVLVFVGLQSTEIVHDRFAAVDPVTNFTFGAGRVAAGPITGYRIAFFVLVTIVVGLVAARAARHQRRVHLPSAASLGLLALLVLAVAVPTFERPALAANEADPPQECTHRDGISYCVHAAHGSQLDSVVSTASRLFRIAGGAPPELNRIHDAALTASGDDTAGPDTVWLELAASNSPRDIASEAVARNLSGEDACLAKYSADRPGGVAEQEDIQYGLAVALSSKEGAAALEDVAANAETAPQSFSPFTSRFTQLSATQLGERMTRHRDAIAHCALTRKQLP